MVGETAEIGKAFASPLHLVHALCGGRLPTVKFQSGGTLVRHDTDSVPTRTRSPSLTSTHANSPGTDSSACIATSAMTLTPCQHTIAAHHRHRHDQIKQIVLTHTPMVGETAEIVKASPSSFPLVDTLCGGRQPTLVFNEW
eukprot:3152503-Amphidinium_carterae.1